MNAGIGRRISGWVLCIGLAWFPVSLPSQESGSAPTQKSDPAANAAGGKPGPTAEELGAADISSQLETIRLRHHVPALAAALSDETHLLAIGATGVRRAGGTERVGLADRFHLGSCTKAMTATLCGILVDEGRLRWDTTIADSFDDLKDRIRPEYLEVTLRDLLCHRSGLPEDRKPGVVLMRMRGLSGDMLNQRRQSVELILSEPPTHARGQAFEYSNGGFIVAGAMAEAAMHQSWEDLMREYLFKPLAMESAGFGPPGSPDVPEAPWGHLAVSDPPRAMQPGPFSDNPAALGPAGTVHASLADWAAFGRLHLRRSSLLKLGTFETLQSDPYGGNYGFGWGLANSGEGKRAELRHAGSNGMWFAQIRVIPSTRRVLLVACNQADPEAQTAVREAMELLERHESTEKGAKDGRP